MEKRRQEEIKKLKNLMLILGQKRKEYYVQYCFVEWCIKGLELEEMFEKEFREARKELLKHFDVPEIHTIDMADEYVLQIYDRYHPIRNNIETMTSIEVVRVYLGIK